MASVPEDAAAFVFRVQPAAPDQAPGHSSSDAAAREARARRRTASFRPFHLSTDVRASVPLLASPVPCSTCAQRSTIAHTLAITRGEHGAADAVQSAALGSLRHAGDQNLPPVTACCIAHFPRAVYRSGPQQGLPAMGCQQTRRVPSTTSTQPPCQPRCTRRPGCRPCLRRRPRSRRHSTWPAWPATARCMPHTT